MQIETVSILMLSFLLIGFLILLPRKQKADATLKKFNWIGGLFLGAFTFVWGVFLLYAHQVGWDTAWPEGLFWDASLWILGIVAILSGFIKIIKSILNRHSSENHLK